MIKNRPRQRYPFHIQIEILDLRKKKFSSLFLLTLFIYLFISHSQVITNIGYSYPLALGMEGKNTKINRSKFLKP